MTGQIIYDFFLLVNKATGFHDIYRNYKEATHQWLDHGTPESCGSRTAE